MSVESRRLTRSTLEYPEGKSKFLWGLIVMCPLNFFVLGTQIFFVQHAFILFCLGNLLSSTRERPQPGHRNRSMLEKLFFAYAIWILVSFSLNSIFSLDPDEQLRRIFSLFMSFSLMGAYFVGRELWILEKNDLKQIILGVFATYSIVIAIKVWSLSQGLAADLFELRVESSQRLPHAIAFVSTIAGVLAIFWNNMRLRLLVLFAFGVFSVLMSLTRGAYLQIAIGAFFIFFLIIRRNLIRNLLITILVVGALAVLATTISATYSGVEQIGARWEQLVDIRQQSEDDPSGAYRLKLWLVIIGKLSEVPVRWLTGYGQLGATTVTGGGTHPSDIASSAHSQYLDTIVRDGAIGLGLFLLIIFIVVKQGFFHLKMFPGESRPVVLAHSIAIVGVLFYSFFHETFRYPLFGFYFWLYAGAISGWQQRSSLEPVLTESFPVN